MKEGYSGLGGSRAVRSSPFPPNQVAHTISYRPARETSVSSARFSPGSDCLALGTQVTTDPELQDLNPKSYTHTLNPKTKPRIIIPKP